MRWLRRSSRGYIDGSIFGFQIRLKLVSKHCGLYSRMFGINVRQAARRCLLLADHFPSSCMQGYVDYWCKVALG